MYKIEKSQSNFVESEKLLIKLKKRHNFDTTLRSLATYLGGKYISISRQKLGRAAYLSNVKNMKNWKFCLKNVCER